MTVLTAASLRARVSEKLSQGWRAASLYATADGQSVRVLLTTADGHTRLETAPVGPDQAVPSIADLAPALGWDEREAHDLYGINFTGHEPLRALADHAAAAQDWITPVAGRDAYQVAVGPIHAGVIESGHFRFHVVGDKILHLDARLFYKHRGLERAAEGRSLGSGLAIIGRACGACAAANSVAYAMAAEQVLGLRPTPQLARARTFLLELERTWNHLNDIAAVCAGTGMAAGQAFYLALTERARRLNAALTGHRFLFGTVGIGASALTVDTAAVRACAAELAALAGAAESGWRQLTFNASFQNRLSGVGVIDGQAVRALGVTGPAARAAGIADDARTGAPQLGYPGFCPVTPAAAAGDVQARLEQRMLELRQTFSLLQELLADGPVKPASAQPGGNAQPTGAGLAESPRGATSCVVESSDGLIGRVRLRTGSYANWPAVARAATGALLPDFPLINKSFELCYACADR